MQSNSRTNSILNSISSSLQNHKMDANDFVTRANDSSMVIENGIIDSLFVMGDSVFAIIRKNTESKFSITGDQLDHGDGWFNGPDRTPVEEVTVAELSILTNIDGSNNQLGKYIDKPCEVVVKSGVAVYASVILGFPTLTTIPPAVIRKAREALQGITEDIFSDVGKRYFGRQGYTEEEIEQLSNFTYVEEMTSKINTFEGEGLWFKDTSQSTKDENIVKTNGLLVGLNKLGMKSNKCHIPTRLFSGK